MFPSLSMAGLETGCIPSAIWIPMSHVQAVSSSLPSLSSPCETPSGTRTITSESEPITTGADRSPKRAVGRSAPAKPLPRMRNSPPGMAADGETSEICGRDSEFLRRAIREQLNKIEPSGAEQHKCGVNSGHCVVEHNARAAEDSFQLTHRRRLPDIEGSKQQERAQPALPVECEGSRERNPLAHDLVDDHDLRILAAGVFRHASGCPDGRRDQEHAEKRQVDAGNAGVCVQAPGDGQRAQRSRRAWTLRDVSKIEPGSQHACQSAHSESSSCSWSGISSSVCGSAGVEIVYFSDAQFPRSMIRQRSLQKGRNSPSDWTTCRQIGHRIAVNNRSMTLAARIPNGAATVMERCSYGGPSCPYFI